eukprot:jgi/Hompol1/1919/HPOL_002798-RA
MLLLEGLKNGISPPVKPAKVPLRVPTIIASFCAQALMILLKPESDMYPLINRFLLQRPVIDFADIPMFYVAFYSSSDNCTKERLWILRLLSMGLKTAADFKLYKRRRVLEILMGYLQSSMAEYVSHKLILEIFFKAMAIRQIVCDLMGRLGFIQFLEAACIQIDMREASDLSLGLVRLTHRALEAFEDIVLSPGPGKIPRRIDRVTASVCLSQFSRIADLLVAKLCTARKAPKQRLTALTLTILRFIQKCLSIAQNEHILNSCVDSDGTKLDMGNSSFGMHRVRQLLDISKQLSMSPVVLPATKLSDREAHRGIGLDLDGLFSVPKIAGNQARLQAMHLVFDVVADISVPPGTLSTLHFSTFVETFNDMLSYCRDSGMHPTAVEPLVILIVRMLLAESADGGASVEHKSLVAYLILEVPSVFCEILQLLFGCLSLLGQDEGQSYMIRHLALSALLLVVQKWHQLGTKLTGTFEASTVKTEICRAFIQTTDLHLCLS